MHRERHSPVFLLAVIVFLNSIYTLGVQSAGLLPNSGVVRGSLEEKEKADSLEKEMASFGMNRRVGADGPSGIQDTRQRTQQPIVTGTTILGLKYKDGVMLAADTLAQSVSRG